MDVHAMEEAAEAEAPFRTKPDDDPAAEAGWFLQRERERRGLGLDDIAEAIGVHPYHLGAIELGDLTRLPARLEVLRMAGLYAQHLGFDPEPLVYHYAAILPKPQTAPREVHPANPAPLSSAKIIKFGRLPKLSRLRLGDFPGGAGGIVASCLGAVLLFGAASWILKPSQEAVPAQQLAAAEDPMPTASTGHETGTVKITEQALLDAEPPAIDSGIAAAVEPPPGEEAEAVDGLTEFIEERVADPKSKVAALPAREPHAAAGGWTYGGENGGSRLVLKAKAPVWVRIEDARGEVVMTQMLMKGDSYQVPAREGLVVIARDGGLLAFEIDGKERGILGPPGEILVGRSLDLKSLEVKG